MDDCRTGTVHSMQHAAVDDGAVHVIAELARASRHKAMIGTIVENRALSRTAARRRFASRGRLSIASSPASASFGNRDKRAGHRHA